MCDNKNYYILESATEEAIIEIITYARHELDFKVLLKPHIDVLNGEWRGNVRPLTQKQNSWWESYDHFILKFAKIAEKLGVEMYSISTELNALIGLKNEWKDLAIKTREVYNGKLVISANHDGAEWLGHNWADVDYIGVDAYYDVFIGDKLNLDDKYGSIELIKEKWQGIIERLQKLSQNNNNKPIVFTELGYCHPILSFRCSQTLQPNQRDYHIISSWYYEAFFEAFAPYKDTWFKGVFWWNWTPDNAYGGDNDDCMTPQWKLAEDVLRTYYGATLPKPEKPKTEPVCKCVL